MRSGLAAGVLLLGSACAPAAPGRPQQDVGAAPGVSLEADGLELHGEGWSLRSRRSGASGALLRAEGLSLEADLAGDGLTVRAPRGKLDLSARELRLEGGVGLARGELRVEAGVLEAAWAEGAALPGAIRDVVLRGDVRVALPTPGALRGRAEAPPQESRALAERAGLDLSTGSLWLAAVPGGDPARLEGEDGVWVGTRVIVDLLEGSARCEGEDGAACSLLPPGAP